MKKVILIFSAVLLAVVPAGAEAKAEEKEEAGSSIYRFLQLNKEYCTGGQPEVSDLAKLQKELGIRAVLNLRRPMEYDEAAEAAEAKRLGLRYYLIPVNSRDLKDEQVEKFLKILDDAENRPVFIHCGSSNRVGGFWMIRRVLVDGWSVEKAEEEANKIGLTNAALRKFVHDYLERRRKP